MSKEGITEENDVGLGADQDKEEHGARLKMPAAQLAQVTKAKKRLEEHLAGNDLVSAAKSLQKYEDEITKLEKQCGLILTLDETQQRQKEEWLNKNAVHLRDDLMDCKTRLQAEGAAAQLTVPRVVINLAADDDKESRKSKISEASSRARQAEAEMIALQMEKERLQKRQAQENEERLLRQQREQDDLEAKIEQAKVRQEALSRASSKCSSVSDIRRKSDRRVLLNLPTATHRTANWIEGTLPESRRTSRANAPQPEQSRANNSSTRRPNLEHEGTTTQLYQQMLLPSSKLPTFKGSYLEFPWFIRSFEMLVEDVTPDPTRRLHLLLQHLEGEPHTLVKGFHLAEPSVAFQLAKQELVQRYGNPIRQSLAFKDQLLSWPTLKKDSASDLEKFFVQLRLCEAMKQSGGGMHELDSPTTLAKLMHKLPQRHQDAWLRRVHKVESIQARETTYSDFTQFIRELSETANHPVFGKQVPQDKIMITKAMTTSVHTLDKPAGASCMATSSEPATTQSKVRTPALSASPEESTKDAFHSPCLICEGNHSTAECDSYKSVPLEERKSKLKGLCFRCLKGDHWARNCKTPATCEECIGRHPTLLHDEKRASKGNKAATTATTTQSTSTDSTETCGATVSNSPGAGSIAAVPVKIWLNSSEGTVTTLAILDTASSASFISEPLASELGIRIEKNTSLTLSTVLETSGTSAAIIRGLKVADIDGNNDISLPPLYTVPELPACTEGEILKREVDKWQHLQRVPFAWEEYKGEVGLLLGQDVPDALCPERVVKGDGKNEPYAALSPLGWTFNGPRDASTNRPNCASLVQATSSDDEILSALQRLFYRGVEDLFDFHSKGLSQDDKEWLRLVESSVCRSSLYPDRFQIAMPFKPGTRLLDNRQQAERQLGALRRKFLQNDQFRNDYTAFIAKMEKAGYVEEVNEPTTTPQHISYVPHHGVYHPRKPGKIRVVFNCSNKYHGISLNDCLLSGPDLTNSLLGVIIRFRQEPVAFIADVESMFYRVLVPPDQRDVLRYLWWPGGDVHQPPKTYRMTVHLFGATSSPSCANYALRKAAEDAHKEGLVSEATKEAVHTNFYVDDCLKSVPTEEQAIEMASELIIACQYGGFKLTKFISTSAALLNSLPSELLAGTTEQATLDDKRNQLTSPLLERALGVAWDIKKDHFYFKLSPPAKAKVTKRSILSTLSMVYDPLGMAAPVVITARILFRELTRGSTTRASWDEDVDEAKAFEWSRWLTALPHIQEVTMPRCYMRSVEGQFDMWQLHAFSDSSLDAYSVVIYLRHGQTNPAVTYLMGKARVTPPKAATIPRLELVAAKLAVDMMIAAQQELQFTIDKRVFWCDSQTVLKYLNCKKRRFHTFVANRVHSILASSNPSEWKFVPTTLNPADEATRGIPAQELARSKWLSGPDFLHQHENDWPHSEPALEPDTHDPEVKDVTVIQTNVVAAENSFINSFAAQFSSMYRFRKAIATLMKYKAFLRKDFMEDKHITVKDLIRSEQAAVKWLQRHTWPQEMGRLEEGKQVKRTSVLWKLSPGIVEGVLVMRSRTRVNLPIIPAGPLADLIILEAHHQQLHYGRQSTSAAVLRKVWVIGLNKAVRRIIRACPSCQLRRAQPQSEEMGALPEFRTEAACHAFATTGVDYFGPFEVKYGARSTTKAYGIIFTCAATRAVHLEAAEDLSSSEFINALRRFVARRGSVHKLITDNGTNFKGAARELNEELQEELDRQQASPAVVQELRKQGIEWTRNAPGASHHGGFWERLIRSIRQAFEAILSIYRPLTFANFLTLLCEVEAALNARPLTAVSEDPLDLEALTPNHLLLARSGPEQQPGDFSTATLVRRHWRHIQHLSHIFWKRWVHEYRTTLHRRTTWLAKNSRPMRIGDIVLVMDPLRHRRYWKLGRILEVESSDPNRPRTVQVKTQDGIYTRPITKLCLLETASQSD